MIKGRLTVLDQLLQTVDAVEIAVLVTAEHIARLEEAVGRKSVFGQLGTFEVAREDVGAAEPELARLCG
jgi:hypothetical protein